jgi:hypothetical protein
VTTRHERIKMHRRMQQRIRLVVEERRMSLALRPDRTDGETTVEIPLRAIGRVSVDSS